MTAEQDDVRADRSALESESLSAPQTTATGVPPQQLKPLLRGWFHTGMAPVMFLAGLVLLVFTPSPTLRIGVVIYLLSAVIMFGNSAVYHRFTWSPEAKAIFRRLDHSFIFTFIAGTYTPLVLSMLHGCDRIVLLCLIWGCATLGLLFRIFWLGAPRWLYTILYIAMGWIALGWLATFWNAGGPVVVLLIILGGLFYTLGALCYALKKPNPWPRWFGFHEIFHLGTVLAALTHFVAIVLAVVGMTGVR